MRFARAAIKLMRFVVWSTFLPFFFDLPSLGLSLNQYVVGLIKKDMEKDKDTEKSYVLEEPDA